MIAALDLRCGIVPVAWDGAGDNAALRPELVVKARATEMEYFRDMGVYELEPRSEIDACGGKHIDTRWIDTNKADGLHLEHRSGRVGGEFNTCKDDPFYAGTPLPHSSR